MIYLDSAATSYHKPEGVADAVADAIRHMGNPGRGAHEASLDASRLIFDTRERLSALFGGDGPSQVVFTANSTESLNMAITGLFGPGDHVITTALEHNSVLRPLYRLEDQGARLSVLPADARGRIRYEDFEAAVEDGTKGIVCTHASNLTGNRLELKRIGQICRKHGLLFIVDASQTAGMMEINMRSMGIDVLCFTGHKSLLGPQGTGGLCVREGVQIRPLVVGGSGVHSYDRRHPASMPTALEAGTLNSHGIAGLHAALCYLQEVGPASVRERELSLMRRFYDGVRAVDGVKVYGDFDDPLRAPIVALNIRDYDSGEVADELASEFGICTRAGAHCAPLLHQALGTGDQGAVRFSFSHFNTEEEIDTAVKAVREIARE